MKYVILIILFSKLSDLHRGPRVGSPLTACFDQKKYDTQKHKSIFRL